jgi:hypothetical protein
MDCWAGIFLPREGGDATRGTGAAVAEAPVLIVEVAGEEPPAPAASLTEALARAEELPRCLASQSFSFVLWA